MDKCPICLTPLKLDQPPRLQAPYNRDKKRFHCISCGRFAMTTPLLKSVENLLANQKKRALLSRHTRSFSLYDKTEDYPTLTEGLVKKILEGELPKPSEQADNLIYWLGRTLEGYGDYREISTSNDSPLIGSLNQDAFGKIIRYLIDDKLIESKESEKISPFPDPENIGLTYKGWERFEELDLGHFNSNKAFMAMQFGETELDNIVDHYFKKAVGDTGYDLQSLLDKPKAGLIDDRMRVEIRRSRFLICDLTHNNRGALWEAGFAEGLGKPVIYTCKESVFDSPDKESRPHFDTNHHLTIKWNSNNPEEAVERLKSTIRETLLGEAKFSD